MYSYQINNTPERIKKQRLASKNVPQTSPKEECPRLTLAPFSRPPTIVFDDVVVGTSSEKYLELFNPSKEIQEISLKKEMPGLCLNIPGNCIGVQPQTCYVVSMTWTPWEQIALRETLRFTNTKRGTFDVIVVLKSILPAKIKTKGLKHSPGKIQKKSLKKSPGNITKKKVQVFNKTSQVTKTVNIVHSTTHKVLMTRNEDVTEYRDVHIENPFETDHSSNFIFNTSEIFPNTQKQITESFMYKTYDKPNSNQINEILKPSNKQNTEYSALDMFDNIRFTPLKSVQEITKKLDDGPKIVFSYNSETDCDNSDSKDDKENESHSIVCNQLVYASNEKWSTVDNYATVNRYHEIATPIVKEKTIPKTSSPKDFNSPNFSINTDYSRISDMSFFPQRYSTERKAFHKMTCESYDIDHRNVKFSTDTFTKESPMENHINQIESQVLQLKEPRMCKQALFREPETRMFNEQYRHRVDQNTWQNDLRCDINSPLRSVTPPLQSIAEESMQNSTAHIFDKTDLQKEPVAINQTYSKQDKTVNKSMWSKKAVVKSKIGQPVIRDPLINHTYVSSQNTTQNLSLSYMPNAYSKSLIVNPFSSSTQYYDEALIKKFEREFKRWLNYILTPPDLESDIEQKIDVGKVWLANRNIEVPTAPTKEKVCSSYHNTHRLESLRKSARVLIKSPEFSDVLRKVNLQVDKKLICIRDDRNLHLDVGLQKTIMEIILSYNPLWLRIGLEVIYNLVLPLKSNSDIEGLTAFIIQRMFRNPFLKSKNSKTAAPNMLRPAYMDAIKKFTLKKFFMLVYFLDQAKRKKLISHDPCLFCRNAICKESRQILIGFTRELIAGIGDITKHLRPTGYVVVHKQTYLDEYKYGVNEIAVDIRDGVRLTKVSEIILLRNDLVKQLRAPAISRLQKIHNVEVALKALREENFNIEGEITAADIADGHREKTLSLLWQLIHVFRAPMFEKAAHVIQLWWRKKYEVILERKQAEKIVFRQKCVAASVIQHWWRQVLNIRKYKHRLNEVTRSTITLQKYYRMWVWRTRFLKIKQSVVKIQRWYSCVKLVREGRELLCKKREEQRLKAVITIQSHVRRWLCEKKYQETIKKVIFTQSSIRRYLERKRFLVLRSCIILIQTRYRSRHNKLAKATRSWYLKQRNSAIKVQNWYRSCKMTQEIRQEYLQMRNACVTIQTFYRSYVLAKRQREQYLRIREATVRIQRYYRGYMETKIVRQYYVELRIAVTNVQRRFRSLLAMKETRRQYLLQKKSAIIIQRRFRALLIMKEIRNEYLKKRSAIIVLQRKFRAQCLMKCQRREFMMMKIACIKIQRFYRSYRECQEQRRKYLEYRRNIAEMEKIKREREEQALHSAATKIQALYRGYKTRASSNPKVVELRKRWQMGGLVSTQKSLAELNDEALYILRTSADIEPVLKAFRVLELTTVLWPKVYAVKASKVLQNVFDYMATTNRSISSVEVLTSGATFLVNLTRYHLTGPKLYKRNRITPILRYMLRFSNSEANLFCRLATYIWLFAKYENTEKDLKQFLQEPENLKVLIAIKNNIGRMRKMASNSTKMKISTPQPSRKISHFLHHNEKVNLNLSMCPIASCASAKNSIVLPALESDYGILRSNKPRYFEDPQQAINCIFSTYDLQ